VLKELEKWKETHQMCPTVLPCLCAWWLHPSSVV